MISNVFRGIGYILFGIAVLIYLTIMADCFVTSDEWVGYGRVVEVVYSREKAKAGYTPYEFTVVVKTNAGDLVWEDKKSRTGWDRFEIEDKVEVMSRTGQIIGIYKKYLISK